MKKLLPLALAVFIALALSVYFDVLNIYSSYAGTPSIMLRNISEYTISPGVFVVHQRGFSMNYLSRSAPAEYELLAETGDPSAVITKANNHPKVILAFGVKDLKPYSERAVDISNISLSGVEMKVSYMAMITETNDGVVWINSVPFVDKGGVIQERDVQAKILDMGTEQNSPIGSGFAGGQPDSSYGDSNIQNGIATPNSPVTNHPQFYDQNPPVSTNIFRILVNP